MKIFFQGSLAGPWCSGWQRCETMHELGHEVLRFSHDDFVVRAAPMRWARLLRVPRFNPQVVEKFNEVWLEALLAARPHVAWLEWPKLLRPETIDRARARLPHCQFVAFYDDNPFGERTDELWQWKLFLDSIDRFDVHLVKRSSDLVELLDRGAPRVELFMHGYYPVLFRPPEARLTSRYPVSFVGTALDHRVPFVRQLIKDSKLPLHVFGNRWERSIFFHIHRQHFHPAALGQDYVDVLWQSRVCLAFVSSSNRDEYSMRTFEIPACRGFMLAERTPTHLSLFQEGVEAEFFDSVEECADKVRFYLRDESARNRIAEAGFQRCGSSGYSLRRRMSDVLSRIVSSDLRIGVGRLSLK